MPGPTGFLPAVPRGVPRATPRTWSRRRAKRDAPDSVVKNPREGEGPASGFRSVRPDSGRATPERTGPSGPALRGCSGRSAACAARCGCEGSTLRTSRIPRWPNGLAVCAYRVHDRPPCVAGFHEDQRALRCRDVPRFGTDLWRLAKRLSRGVRSAVDRWTASRNDARWKSGETGKKTDPPGGHALIQMDIPAAFVCSQIVAVSRDM